MSELKQASLEEQRVLKVRRWIYAYFLLLIFEGVLRKWGSLNFLVSSALLLVRDPVVLMIYYLAMRARAFPHNRFTRIWAISLAVLCMLGLLQVFFNPWLGMFVVIYGIRCYCMHIPLIR